MFAYTVKKTDQPYRPMPLDKRAGKVPDQGYCSKRPASGQNETLRAGARGICACIYGEPYDERITLEHEALQVRVIEKIPEPPDIADVLPEVRRLLREGKGHEADALSVETAKKRGYGELLKFAGNDPRNIELPVSAYHNVPGVMICLGFDHNGDIYNYLRTSDFRTVPADGRTVEHKRQSAGLQRQHHFPSRGYGGLLPLC